MVHKTLPDSCIHNSTHLRQIGGTHYSAGQLLAQLCTSTSDRWYALLCRTTACTTLYIYVEQEVRITLPDNCLHNSVHLHRTGGTHYSAGQLLAQLCTSTSDRRYALLCRTTACTTLYIYVGQEVHLTLPENCVHTSVRLRQRGGTHDCTRELRTYLCASTPERRYARLYQRTAYIPLCVYAGEAVRTTLPENCVHTSVHLRQRGGTYDSTRELRTYLCASTPERRYV